jgi:hypothetical protein
VTPAPSGHCIFRAPQRRGIKAGGNSVSCAGKTSIGKVQEVGIGISRASGIATDMNKALSTAVDKAGEFCHAKGQKFLLKSAVGSTVVFRCVATGPSPE